MNSHLYCQMNFEKDTKATQPFQQVYRENDIHVQKNEGGPYPTLYTKVNSKWIAGADFW